MEIKKFSFLIFAILTVLLFSVNAIAAEEGQSLNDSNAYSTDTTGESHRTDITLNGRGRADEHQIRQRTRLRQTNIQPTGFFVNEGDRVVINVSGQVNGNVFASIGVPEIDAIQMNANISTS